MNGRPIVIFLALLHTPWISADTLEADTPVYSADETEPATNTFGLRTYSAEPDYSALNDDWSGREVLKTVPEKKRVLVVDYYPFDSSGFRVSAGAYSGEQNTSSQYTLNDGIAYFGVGWKAMLGEAKRLDLSVEVGTFFGSSYEADGQATGSDGVAALPASSGSESDDSGSTRPVISFGMAYRF